MIIRSATPSDIYRIHKIHTSAIRELCAFDYRPEQIEAWVNNRKPEGYLHYIKKFRFFVAELDEKVVGYACYRTKSKEFYS